MATNQDNPAPAVETRDLGVNIDSLPEPVAPPLQEPVKPAARVFTRERASNQHLNPHPRPEKIYKGSNTLQKRSIPKYTATEIISKDKLENKISDAVLMPEEDIMSR